MSRARSKIYCSKEIIDKIEDIELHKIAYMYYIQRMSMLDIAFEMNYSEKTIQRRIKEIRTRYIA